MEKLKLLARILRYSLCCSRMRTLKHDILAALATGRPTDAEIAELLKRSRELRLTRGDVIL